MLDATWKICRACVGGYVISIDFSRGNFDLPCICKYENGKFISNILTPVNNFISDDFKLYNDDYKEITKKMPVKKQRKITLPLIPYKMNHVKQCKFKI